MKFGKLHEFIYSLSTQDKYSEFDPKKSFNRVNTQETELLFSHHNQSTASLIGGPTNDVDSTVNKNQFDGVHEVRLAWRHIKNWLLKYSPDLNSTLQSPCTDADLSDFQKDLNIKLPNCLIEFYKITDGQSYFNDNGSGGLVFGLKLMPIDEIMVMTEHWRKVADYLNLKLLHANQTNKLQELSKLETSHANSSQLKFSSSNLDLIEPVKIAKQQRHESAGSPNIPRQKSIPPGTIHDSFAHPMWIPIITDEVGNCIGIDLCPPTNGGGTWGQVILFGREFDNKYLIADNFGDFLLIFANDLEMGNWDFRSSLANNNQDLLIGSEGELVFVEKGTNKEIPYLEVLKKRCIEKWLSSLNELNSEKSEEIKHLIKDLNLNTSSILKFKNSMDQFVNNNISSIEGISDPIIHSENQIAGGSDNAKNQVKLGETSDTKQDDTSKIALTVSTSDEDE